MKHIEKVSRYEALLNNGIKLEIPKARYKFVEETFVSYKGEIQMLVNYIQSIMLTVLEIICCKIFLKVLLKRDPKIIGETVVLFQER